MTPTLTPAYGRDYVSEPEAIRAFNLGRDFIYNVPLYAGQSGRYCSIRDFAHGDEVALRFNKKTTKIIIKVGDTT